MRKPSPAMLVALLALFVALGGIGLAATGGNFILGQSNSADKSTALNVSTLPGSTTCPAPCQALQVTDNSTAANAGGLGVVGKSASTPAATIKNTGGATALSLLVNSGKPPFTVNSTTRVTNLNADLLDSHDSTYFLPKTGKAADADKLDGIDSTGFLRNQPDGVWHYIGDPGEPVFQSAWVNYDPATIHTNAFFQHAAYYRDRLGIVHLGGLIKDGYLASTVFALPGMGLCPYYARTWAQISAGGVARVTLTHLEPTGTCRLVVDSGSNLWVSLDGISYRVWNKGDSS